MLKQQFGVTMTHCRELHGYSSASASRTLSDLCFCQTAAFSRLPEGLQRHPVETSRDAGLKGIPFL